MLSLGEGGSCSTWRQNQVRIKVNNISFLTEVSHSAYQVLHGAQHDLLPDHSKGSIGCRHFKSGSALAGNARQNRCIRRTCCKRVAPLTLQHWTLLPTCMYELHRVYHENVSLRIEICRASLTVPTPMLLLGLYKCVVSTRATSCVRTKGAKLSISQTFLCTHPCM